MNRELLLSDLCFAYMDARKNKIKTHNHRKFEEHVEDNLVQLCDDLLSGKYCILPSIYFIQQSPIQREIFAGNFRDRVVHHLVYNYIAPYWEKQFIYDSYSCRKGKGTALGIKRIAKYMRSCTQNYTTPGWILKLDIQGYFMGINKEILRKKISEPVLADQLKIPKIIVDAIYTIIFNDPTSNGVFKGKRSDYHGLPKTKSLFFAHPNCGLPIGNLTSQLFSNIYLNDFDHFIKKELGIKYYGRYVDDFILIHQDKEYLKSVLPLIKQYLYEKLGLMLHPNKIYFQTVSHGVPFLGAIIKPYRTYIQKKTIGAFYEKIQKFGGNPPQEVVASYVGFLSHHKSYTITQKILSNLYF